MFIFLITCSLDTFMIGLHIFSKDKEAKTDGQWDAQVKKKICQKVTLLGLDDNLWAGYKSLLNFKVICLRF